MQTDSVTLSRQTRKIDEKSNVPSVSTQEWQTVNSRNKRQRSSPEGNNSVRKHKQTRTIDYWLSTPVPITNKFDNLKDHEESETDVIKLVKKNHRQYLFQELIILLY